MNEVEPVSYVPDEGIVVKMPNSQLRALNLPEYDCGFQDLVAARLAVLNADGKEHTKQEAIVDILKGQVKAAGLAFDVIARHAASDFDRLHGTKVAESF